MNDESLPFTYPFVFAFADFLYRPFDLKVLK